MAVSVVPVVVAVAVVSGVAASVGMAVRVPSCGQTKLFVNILHSRYMSIVFNGLKLIFYKMSRYMKVETIQISVGKCSLIPEAKAISYKTTVLCKKHYTHSTPASQTSARTRRPQRNTARVLLYRSSRFRRR